LGAAKTGLDVGFRAGVTSQKQRLLAEAIELQMHFKQLADLSRASVVDCEKGKVSVRPTFCNFDGSGRHVNCGNLWVNPKILGIMSNHWGTDNPAAHAPLLGNPCPTPGTLWLSDPILKRGSSKVNSDRDSPLK
jgi:hypothetical protein